MSGLILLDWTEDSIPLDPQEERNAEKMRMKGLYFILI